MEKVEKAILGKKVGMTQIFDADGKVIPVTVIEAGPCTVLQKKTMEKDGYEAVQLGFEDVPERKLTKPELGHLKKAGDARKKHLREVKLGNAAALNVGDVIKADVLRKGSRGRNRYQPRQGYAAFISSGTRSAPTHNGAARSQASGSY